MFGLLMQKKTEAGSDFSKVTRALILPKTIKLQENLSNEEQIRARSPKSPERDRGL